MSTANAVLDEHLEEQERALRSFSQTWWDEHREATSYISAHAASDTAA